MFAALSRPPIIAICACSRSRADGRPEGSDASSSSAVGRAEGLQWLTTAPLRTWVSVQRLPSQLLRCAMAGVGGW